MFRRSALAIIAAAALLPPGTTAQRVQLATLDSRVVWSMSNPAFGGWSGVELSPDGRTFVMISDRGSIMTGRLVRDTENRIAAVRTGTIRSLGYTDGGKLPRYRDDAEGLALAADGRIYVSFEAVHRVAVYPNALGEAAEILPTHKDFDGMKNNSSLEALAVGPDGAVYTIPERSGRYTRPFPVYRYRDGKWDKPFRIPRRGDFLVVGADIGPDGRFYVLERKFKGIFGFGTRVRRFDIGERELSGEVTLFETFAGTHDNLEGLAVWQDGDERIRLTMISDNNFRFFQNTEFVEYIVAE